MALCSAGWRLALGAALLLVPLATGCANDFDGLFKTTDAGAGSTDGGDSSTAPGVDESCKDLSCTLACPPNTPCLLICTTERATCQMTGCAKPVSCPAGESKIVVCNRDCP